MTDAARDRTGTIPAGTQEVLRALAAVLPGPEAASLRPGEDARRIPASLILDDRWLAEEVLGRARAWGTDDRHVLATLWWYSASHVLVTPTLAALLVTGRGLDPALDRLWLHRLPDGRVTGADSTRVLAEPGAAAAGRALHDALAAAIVAVSRLTTHGPGPLWALAADGIANRLLTFGRPLGRAAEASALAEDVVAGIGERVRLPRPRFVDTPRPDGSGPVRFVRRSSCCLVYRVAGEDYCTSCPRRPAGDRAARMREAAAYF